MSPYLANDFLVFWVISSLELRHVHVIRIDEFPALKFDIIEAAGIRVDHLFVAQHAPLIRQ